MYVLISSCIEYYFSAKFTTTISIAISCLRHAKVTDRQAIKGIKRTKATSFKYEYSYGQLLIYTCRIAMTKNDEKIFQIENSKIF